MKIQRLLVILIFLWSNAAFADDIPAGFVSLKQTIPSIKTEVRYAGSDNFIGKPIDGYTTEIVYLSKEAAAKLKSVQTELRALDLSLKVYDAYRPQRAVDHFVAWSKDMGDQKMKAKYYPELAKDRIIPDGYVAEKSGHSRGSTLDLTIVKADGTELDMGTHWDLFGPPSGAFYKGITSQQRANRLLLRSLMTKHGFKPYNEEWWHFTLKDEPYPERYFDFEIE